MGGDQVVEGQSREEVGDLAPELDWERTALVVVDMQEYFCRRESNFGRFVAAVDPDGAEWYSQRVADTVIPNIAVLLDLFRCAGAPVVFTEFGSHRSDGRDMPGWARRHNELAQALTGGPCYPPFDDPSCRVAAAVAPLPGELVVQKVTSGPAAGTNLEFTLRRLGLDTVVLVGVATNVCVAGMARELADADFDAYIVDDACATIGESAHDAALDALKSTFAYVFATAEMTTLLPNGDDPRRRIGFGWR